MWLLYSQTKPITSCAIWYLVEHGLLRFHDAVAGFDPDPYTWPDSPNPPFDRGGITHNDPNLDNVVFRMGFADTRAEARQLVRHGHFTVNGKKATIPSMRLKPGDVIRIDLLPQTPKFREDQFRDLFRELERGRGHSRMS